MEADLIFSGDRNSDLGQSHIRVDEYHRETVRLPVGVEYRMLSDYYQGYEKSFEISKITALNRLIRIYEIAEAFLHPTKYTEHKMKI